MPTECNTHKMKLYDGPFELMKAGQKTIEVRCNDEKRQKIQVGDVIIFCRFSDSEERLITRVVEIQAFSTFRELYASFPMGKFGTPERTVDDMVQAVDDIYTEEEQGKYGALAITIELMPQITRLKGPDRVRKRPAVLFLSDGVDGAQEAVLNLLHIFVREALLGHCKHIKVKQNGACLEIRGDDRGIYLGQDTGDDTNWKAAFCSMFPFPKYRPDESGYSLEFYDDNHYALYGEELPPEAIYFKGDFCYMELYALQCSCKYMDVLVNRNGVQSKLHFEQGYNIGGISHAPTEEPNGSCFNFELDNEVFSEVTIPESYFLQTLQIFAFHAPGLKCTYENADGKEVSFCYPSGISDYVQSKITEPPHPVYHKHIEAKGRNRYNLAEYKTCVEISVGFTPNAGSLRCFHNFRELTYGGTHRDELQKQLCRALNACYWRYIVGDEDRRHEKELTWEEIAQHVTAVIISWCPSSCCMWENGSRLSIKNQVIADITHDAMVPEFENYVYQHKEEYRKLVDLILEEHK